MLELGDDGPDYHREVGRHLSDLGIERVIAVGELSVHLRSLRLARSALCQYRSAVGRLPGVFQDETILVKGSRGMQLDRL